MSCTAAGGEGTLSFALEANTCPANSVQVSASGVVTFVGLGRSCSFDVRASRGSDSLVRSFSFTGKRGLSHAVLDNPLITSIPVGEIHGITERDGVLYATASGGIATSTNGSTFSGITGRSTHRAGTTVLPAEIRRIRNVDGALVVATSNGAYRSQDGGQTWHTLIFNMPVLPNRLVRDIDGAGDRFLFGGDFGAKVTPDAGATALAVQDGASANLPDGLVRCLNLTTSAYDSSCTTPASGSERLSANVSAVKVFDCDHDSNAMTPDARCMLAGFNRGSSNQYGGVAYSHDNGQTWRASTGLANAMNFPNLSTRGFAHDGAAGKIYAATSEGLYVSTDAAASFSRIGAVNGRTDLEAIALDDTLTPTRIWVGSTDGGLVASTDGGGTWGAVEASVFAPGATERNARINFLAKLGSGRIGVAHQRGLSLYDTATQAWTHALGSTHPWQHATETLAANDSAPDAHLIVKHEKGVMQLAVHTFHVVKSWARRFINTCGFADEPTSAALACGGMSNGVHKFSGTSDAVTSSTSGTVGGSGSSVAGLATRLSGGARYFAAGVTGSPASTIVSWSSDGTTWNQVAASAVGGGTFKHVSIGSDLRVYLSTSLALAVSSPLDAPPVTWTSSAVGAMSSIPDLGTSDSIERSTMVTYDGGTKKALGVISTSGAAFSLDGGATWTATPALPPGNGRKFLIHKRSETALTFIVVTRQGLMFSDDSGATWTRWDGNTAASQDAFPQRSLSNLHEFEDAIIVDGILFVTERRSGIYATAL